MTTSAPTELADASIRSDRATEQLGQSPMAARFPAEPCDGDGVFRAVAVLRQYTTPCPAISRSQLFGRMEPLACAHGTAGACNNQQLAQQNFPVTAEALARMVGVEYSMHVIDEAQQVFMLQLLAPAARC